MERLHIRTLLRRMFLDMNKNVLKIAAERKALRDAGQVVEPIVPIEAKKIPKSLTISLWVLVNSFIRNLTLLKMPNKKRYHKE